MIAGNFAVTQNRDHAEIGEGLSVVARDANNKHPDRVISLPIDDWIVDTLLLRCASVRHEQKKNK
jgi:hypothetical protein